jgi:UrcA family protein
LFEEDIMTTLKILAPLATLAMLSVPAMASARSISIDVHAFDLATKAGRAQLEQRIDRAARRVCASNGIKGVEGNRREARCRAHAKDSAKAQRSHH